MNTAPASAQAQDGASDINRFRHPIEFLFKEHDRLLEILATLELLAHDCTADSAPENAALVLGYLEHEMPLHIADEEEDLFPLLTRRCAPEDEIDELVALLSSEHETDEKHYLALLAPLRAIVNGRPPPTQCNSRSTPAPSRSYSAAIWGGKTAPSCHSPAGA